MEYVTPRPTDAFAVPGVRSAPSASIQAKNREFAGLSTSANPVQLTHLTPTQARLEDRMVGTVVDRETLVEKLQEHRRQGRGLLAPGRSSRLRVRRQRRRRRRDRRPKRRRPADDSAAGGRDRAPGSPGWSAGGRPRGRHRSLRRRGPPAGRDHHQPDPDEPHPRDRPRRPHRAGRAGGHQSRALRGDARPRVLLRARSIQPESLHHRRQRRRELRRPTLPQVRRHHESHSRSGDRPARRAHRLDRRPLDRRTPATTSPGPWSAPRACSASSPRRWSD